MVPDGVVLGVLLEQLGGFLHQVGGELLRLDLSRPSTLPATILTRKGSVHLCIDFFYKLAVALNLFQFFLSCLFTAVASRSATGNTMLGVKSMTRELHPAEEMVLR
jgi:hypothetical protein